MNQDGSGYTAFKSFKCSDGANPFAALVPATNGLLYGSTFNGGAYGNGTIFHLDPVSGAYAAIKYCQANGQDGAQPTDPLIHGILYGTTGYGGLGSQGPGTGQGTAFGIDLAGLTYSVLWNFSGPGGGWG